MQELAFSTLAESIALIFSFPFCVAASFFDCTENRIPNKLNFAALIAALSIAFFGGIGRALFFQYAASLFFSAVFAFLLFRVGAWRGGDAKFFVALGAFLPLLLPGGAWGVFSFLEVFLASAFFLLAHACFSGASLEFRRSVFWALPAGAVKDFKITGGLIGSRGGLLAFAPFLSLGFFAVVAFHRFLA